jgi:hypothetical protein
LVTVWFTLTKANKVLDKFFFELALLTVRKILRLTHGLLIVKFTQFNPPAAMEVEPATHNAVHYLR